MPYTKGLMYVHCHLLYQGCNTQWCTPLEDEVQELDDKFDSLLKR